MSSTPSSPPTPASRHRGGCGGGIVMAFIGLVIGGVIGGLLPLQFDRVRTRGVEAVQLKVLGMVVRQSAGGPGELDRALASTRMVLIVGLAVLGSVALGGIGAVVSSGTRPPPSQPGLPTS